VLLARIAELEKQNQQKGRRTTGREVKGGISGRQSRAYSVGVFDKATAYGMMTIMYRSGKSD